MYLRVGIVGTGWVATNRHIPAYRSDPRVRIVALASPGIEEARNVSRRFGIKGTYPDLHSMLLTEKPDIVSICAPPFVHESLAIEAMENGSNVLVEKPMAMTPGEADSMLVCSKNNGAKLCVNHNFLFSRSLLRLKRLRSEGCLGRTQGVQAFQVTNLKRRLPKWFPSLPGGLFYDEAPHMIYLIEYLLGAETMVNFARAMEVNGQPQSLSRVEALFAAGLASGHLLMLFNAPRDEWRLTIFTSEKICWLDIFSDRLIILPRGGEHTPRQVLTSLLSASLQEDWTTISSGWKWLTRRLLYGQDTLVRRFVDSIVTDELPPVPGSEGKKVIEIMHEILRQSKHN